MQNNEQPSRADNTVVIQYNMTNDYMFRYILQKNEKVLRGLVCALLHLKPTQLKDVEIKNPMDLSKNITGKDFVLDIKILLNNNHSQVYSDKFTLSVVDLTQIEKATEEDKSSKIDYWARLFKAQTWEELQMLAQNDEYLQAAATSLRLANEKEIVREQCRAREDALRRERTLERDNKILLQQKQALQDENASQQVKITTLQAENASLQDENTSLRKQIAEMQGHNSN